jgi:tetratricopeptide (TPR) repeat protein
MSPSIVDKYEQIFAADPRSRIFVELARALLERGDPARAIEVCKTGLEHHPSSILGRVIWGRALLALDDLPGAQDQFEIAIALDPASPYAFNLVGEALYAKGLYRESLPVLARAAELQPGDERLRGWLEDARRKAHGGAAPAAPDPSLPESSPTPALGSAPTPAPTAAAKAAPRPAAAPRKPRQAQAPAAAKAEASPAPRRSEAEDQAIPVIPAATDAAPPAAAPAAPARSPQPPHAPPTPPPMPPVPIQKSLHRDEIPRSLLSMIPGATRPGVALPTAAAAPPPPDEAQAQEITERYAREIRERLAEEEPGPSLLRRHAGLLLGALVVAGLVAAGWIFLHYQEVNRGERTTRAAAAARAGLARDTVGALREAARVLAEARKQGPAPELASLAAQVEALLAVEHADVDARPLAAELAKDPQAGDGGRAAAYLLARTPGELVSSESAVLAAPPSSEPLLQELAGRILLKRGEKEAARGRFEIAAHAAPPLLRALSDLGDLAMAAGDPAGALAYYTAAISAHATHPRSVVGAAEARLALGQDLQRARADLDALAADPGSAPPPDLRVRYELASARVIFATGDPATAVTRLSRAGAALGENAALSAAAAEIHLATRAYDRAEATAARAVALSPGDASARVLLARARIARGRYAEALAATGNAEGRAIWIQRGVARYRLGQYAEAERELTRTAPAGKMPAEAVVWYALCRMKLGHAEEARGILETAASKTAPPPLTWVALGQVLEKLDRADEAANAYRTAAQRDPTAPEGHAALGLLLHSRGDDEGAVLELQKAVAADPGDLQVRMALGTARLATGQPGLARADLDAVLLVRPADLDALSLLSRAFLLEGKPADARKAADRGLARAPNHPGLLLAAARAAQAQGDVATARSLAERAVKASKRGPLSAEALALKAELRKK